MKLLIFAHKGEAQAFIHFYKLQPVDYFVSGLFRNDQMYLLISGEGSQSSSEKTISVLASFNQEIFEIYNIGIAGSLNSNFKKMDLIWIRTAYAHHAEKLEFKSFTSNSSSPKVDCISAFARIISIEERLKLSCFADIVDRELWSIASAANLYKKPFHSIKIISDDLSQINNKYEICQLIKDEAPLFSELLLAEFKSSLNLQDKKMKVIENSFLSNEAYYFTTTQKRKFIQLTNALNLKNINIESLNFNDLIDLDCLPKERSRLLLLELNDIVNPFSKKIRQSIGKAIAPLEQAGINATVDPNLEQNYLHLTMKIQSERDIDKIQAALELFSFTQFNKIFKGDLGDV